jgi:lactoylglutathione lyase
VLVVFPKTMMANWNERKPSIVFDCVGVKDTHNEMTARGVEFTQAPQEMGWGAFAIFLAKGKIPSGLTCQHMHR